MAAVGEAQTCDEQTSETACVAVSSGCAWQLTAEGDDSFDAECVACSTFDDDPWLCVSPCAYDEDAGTCGLPEPSAMPTAAPVSTDAETGVVETVVRIELSSTNLTDDQIEAAASLVNDVMAGQTAAEPTSDDLVQDACGYAPLCGSADYMVDVLPSTEEYSVLFNTMEACCPARDTAAVEACEIVDLTGAACRVSGFQEPICSDLSNPTENCLALSENPDEATLILSDLAFTDGGATGGCCETCTCYGDPNCISFNGTKTSWRVCDARDTDTNKCKINKSTCNSVVDTNGNACEWKPDSWESWWESGSPCQPASGGNPSWLLMYQADDFGMFVRQEERGVIRQVYIMTSAANYSLDATDCLESTTLSGSWNLVGDSWPSYTSNWVRTSSDDVFDVTWYVVDGATNIQASITCLGTVNPDDADKELSEQEYGNYRINVDAVIEPNENWIQERDNLNGFCYTNSLITDVSTEAEIASLEQHLETEALCADKETVYDTAVALDVARQLCGNGVNLAGMQAECFEPFCENYAPLASSSIDVDTCIEYFADLEVAEGFCRVAFSSTANIEQCIDDASEFNLTDSIITFLNTAGGSNTTCISSIDELDTSLASCVSGVTLQYQATAGDETSWTDYKAFPSGRGLCSQEIDIPYNGNEVLFTNPIRMEQCSRDPSCGPVEQCNWVDGVEFTLTVSTPQLVNPGSTPTQEPTTGPTECGVCVDEPEVQSGVTLSSDVCVTDIDFTSDDLDGANFCYSCDFTADEAIRNTDSDGGNYVSLGDACAIEDDDTDGLEMTCAQVCFALSDEGCDAWLLMGGDCFLYSCEDDDTVFVDGSGTGASVCIEDDTTPEPTPEPTSEPTPQPTAEPTTDCDQEVCLTNDDAPTVETGIYADDDVCAHNLTFTADDLPDDEFCYCSFTDEDILTTSDEGNGAGNYVNLLNTCDLSSDDEDDLNEACAHLCELVDGCDAWVLSEGACFIFTCDDSAEASDYFVSGPGRGAVSCPSCDQEVCIDGSDAPTVQDGLYADSDVCSHNVTFTADDLPDDDFCYCSFSDSDILTTTNEGNGAGNYVNLINSCSLDSSDEDDLNEACAHICELVDGCDAWLYGSGECYLFDCDDSVETSEYFTTGNYRGAEACSSCTQEVCLDGEDTPTIQTNVVVDEDVCTHDIFFDEGDLDVDEFCATCEFSSDNILTTGDDSGNYVVLTDACDIDSDDADALNAACAHICELLDGCDAWVQMYGQCYVFTCDGNVDEYFEDTTAYESYGAPACTQDTPAPTLKPTPAPFGWSGRRALKASMLTSTEQHTPRTLTNLPTRLGPAKVRADQAADVSAATQARALARRALRTPGTTVYLMTSYVMFTDGTSATDSVDAVVENPSSTVEAIQTAFDNSDEFSDITVTVTGVTASASYEYYILRFEIPYTASEHSTTEFNDALCYVISTTVSETSDDHDMGDLECGDELTNFGAYAEDDGDLAVYFRIESSSVSPGDFQTLFAMSSTRSTFESVIESCDTSDECDLSAITDLASTLKASFLSASAGSSSSGGLSTAGVALLCVALIGAVVAAGLVVYRRRVQRARKAELDQKQLATRHQYGYDDYDDEDYDA
ncbi:Hypothetical Protein FCC1311_063532 [Hondaea fermentalgiana]|uniref:Uncharacterized protein n=1 Tax=Hondaea fermentalgiana TaxID=2315210 RepID=A0A2R5GND6_9STRA|nr:Hypothetical Protein FCC1311_063532 [Hondaea fermentalgiana]|eukprot:GBG30133.1 Hypothetical Protein FCC1311_063532 [Hondaea fermentalgiana]